MTPRALFNRVMHANPVLHSRYKNPNVLNLTARSVFLGILELIAGSPERGVYRPNPELDGDEPLPALIARSIDAVGAESEISRQLALLARLEFLVITNQNCIIVHLGRTLDRRARTSRSNGSAGGRPRAGETPEQAQQRRRAEGQGSLMLPLAGGTGPVPYGDRVVGDELAQQLRSQIRIAGDAEPDDLENLTANLTANPAGPIETLDLGLPPGLAVSPLPRAEEEEAREQESPEEQSFPTSSSSSARVDAPAKTETETQTGNLTPKPKPNPISAISEAAIALASRAAIRWSWPERELPLAQRVMQDRLNEGWTVDQVEKAIDGPAAARSASIYSKVLAQMFGQPGLSRGPHHDPAPVRDTRNYPPDLAGDWAEAVAKIRDRLRKMDEGLYRNWLRDARLTHFDDGELHIWSDTGFKAQYLRNNEEDRLLRVIRAIAPSVTRLVFTSPSSQPLSKTG